MLRRLARDKVAATATVVLTLIALAAIFAPVIAPYDPYFTDLTIVMQPPSADHWFGTDNTGRDILSRVIYGTRNTLMLGLVGVLIGGLFGGLLGILAAFYAGLDGWIMPGRHHAGLPGYPLASPWWRSSAPALAPSWWRWSWRPCRMSRASPAAPPGVMGQEFMEAGRAVASRPHADLALPDAQPHLDHLRVPDLALRQIILVGSALASSAWAVAADRQLGMMAPRAGLSLHGAAHRDHPESRDLHIVLAANLLGDALRESRSKLQT